MIGPYNIADVSDILVGIGVIGLVWVLFLGIWYLFDQMVKKLRSKNKKD